MSTVRQLLKEKGNQIWSVSLDTTVSEAIEIMSEKNIGSLLIVENDNLEGIFTERDYVRKLMFKDKNVKQVTVSELMSKKVVTVDPDKNMEDCMLIMTKNNIRHLPVIENGSIVGLISMRDVVNDVIADQRFVINELQNLISKKKLP